MTDQLRLAGLVLGALESGRMPMHARDYFDIASAATRELALLDTEDLEHASHRMPPALRGLVENVLFQRVNARPMAVPLWQVIERGTASGSAATVAADEPR